MGDDFSSHQSYIDLVCAQAKQSSSHLANLSGQMKNSFLATLGRNLVLNQDEIITENQKDILQAGKDGLSPALVDRLLLTVDRIKGLTQSINEIISISDPVGEITQGWVRPNGLRVQQERVPLGVLLAIYESRPNVSLDIASLCIKSGNAVILRGGKEAYHSNQILGRIIQSSLKKAGLPKNAVQMISRQDREIVQLLLSQKEMIDLVIPRGGSQLIAMVSTHSQIPVIKHDKGLCHLYLEQDAPRERAIALTLNSKAARPGVCNAIETLLVHQNFPHLAAVLEALESEGVEIRLDESLQADFPNSKKASQEDWSTEYLDLILSVKKVTGVEEAVGWINRYGSQHTEVIVSENLTSINYFKQRVDASCVVINASSRFTDGSALGLGAEVGVSTQKLHVRGPVGVKDLTCLKFQLTGDGQLRT